MMINFNSNCHTFCTLTSKPRENSRHNTDGTHSWRNTIRLEISAHLVLCLLSGKIERERISWNRENCLRNMKFRVIMICENIFIGFKKSSDSYQTAKFLVLNILVGMLLIKRGPILKWILSKLSLLKSTVEKRKYSCRSLIA